MYLAVNFERDILAAYVWDAPPFICLEGVCSMSLLRELADFRQSFSAFPGLGKKRSLSSALSLPTCSCCRPGWKQRHTLLSFSFATPFVFMKRKRGWHPRLMLGGHTFRACTGFAYLFPSWSAINAEMKFLKVSPFKLGGQNAALHAHPTAGSSVILMSAHPVLVMWINHTGSLSMIW